MLAQPVFFHNPLKKRNGSNCCLSGIRFFFSPVREEKRGVQRGEAELVRRQ